MSPQNPFAGLLSGVHTILCLGHRSFLCSETRMAKGSVSSNPRGYWSVHIPSPEHPCGSVRIALLFVLWVDLPFQRHRQTSTSSVRLFPARHTYPFYLAAH